MGRYIAKRLLIAVPVLFGISVVIFLLVRLIPGDIIDVLLGSETALSPVAREQLRKTLGIDQPLYLQYLAWLGGVLHGDLGRSLRTGQPVMTNLLHRLPITFELTLLATLLSLLFSVPLGMISALRRNSRTDFVVRLFGLFGLSLPNFWLATMLILVASVYFHWSASLIFVNFFTNPVENLSQMFLPALSLALALSAVVMRMTRSSMLEVLSQDYIKTARAKGLGERAVLFRHALRTALLPIVTVVGIQIGNLLGGAVVVEQIFGLPGMGSLLLNGIYQRDYPTVQAGVLVLALVFVFANLIVDVLYGFLDPRIQYQ